MTRRLAALAVVITAAGCRHSVPVVLFDQHALSANAEPSAHVTPPGAIVVKGGSGVALAFENVSDESATLCQDVISPPVPREVTRAQLTVSVEACLKTDVPCGIALRGRDTAGATEDLVVLRHFDESQRTQSVRFAIPSSTNRLELCYQLGARQEMRVAQLAVAQAPEPVPALNADALAALATVADVGASLRYFSPSAFGETAWDEWFATANQAVIDGARQDELARQLTILTSAVDASASVRFAPRSAGQVPANAVDTAVVRHGARTDLPFVSFVDGQEPPEAAVAYLYWHVFNRPVECRTVSITVDVKSRESDAHAELKTQAWTGGTSSDVTKIALSSGATTHDVVVPDGTMGMDVGIRMSGKGTLEFAPLRVACDHVALPPLALSDAHKQGAGSALYSIEQGNCDGCIAMSRVATPIRGAVVRRSGDFVLEYSANAPAENKANGGERRARYTGGAMRLAAVQILYGELSSFAVKAATRQRRLRAALEAALRAMWTSDSLVRSRDSLLAITASLDDAHARVGMTDQDAGTLPFEIRRVGDVMLVSAVVAGYEKLIRVGDELLEVGGMSALGLHERMRELVSAASIGWSQLGAARYMLYGPLGSLSELKLRGADGEVRNLVVSRLPKSSVLGSLRAPRPAQGAELAPGVRYLDLSSVTGTELDSKSEQLATAGVLVLDLRGYIGDATFDAIAHLLEQPVRTPMWEVPVVGPGGVVGIEASYWRLYPRRPHFSGHVIVMTDAHAVSAAETVLSLLRARGDVVVVGEPSAGTNGNVARLELPNGMYALYTGMKVRSLDGTDYNETQASVDVPVSLTLADLRAGRDPILERGIALAAELATHSGKQ